MAERRQIGNIVGPWRFLLFLAVLLIGFPIASGALHRWALGAMTAFDLAAIAFLLVCAPLFGTHEARVIKEHAKANDANRALLLILTAIVVAVLFVAISAEAIGHNAQPLTKMLIIVTLALAWLFSNLVLAFHYAHLVYNKPSVGCVGLEFPRTSHPVYWDFIYFSFTCGIITT